ncbi:hypothetical protein OHB12_03490 [Nocardia sp. NBC_01730]|uniref:hypothetical protein n=1 Tax=Nocardia sp. NBC_01730 TaxID=2975998 RepID=UPI002E10280C|nr:hypothetical protein OHB12_03490 [Nocardia sp. NBC_01730]
MAFRSGRANTFLELEEHQRQLRRCLTDDSLAMEVRLAGALIRLYATALNHLVELTVDRFHRDNHHAYLTIDKHPVLLPPSLARLVEQLIEQRVHKPLIPVAGESIYLFPGRPANRQRQPHSLRQLLTANGLPNLSARNTAMITIGADLPPTVVADLLAIHPATAERWAKFAQSSWSDYLAARAALAEPAPPEPRADLSGPLSAAIRKKRTVDGPTSECQAP